MCRRSVTKLSLGLALIAVSMAIHAETGMKACLAIPDLISQTDVYEGERVKVVGIFLHHPDEPSLVEIDEDGKPLLTGTYAALEFSSGVSAIERYRGLDRKLVEVRGKYHCVEDEGACAFHLIVVDDIELANGK